MGRNRESETERDLVRLDAALDRVQALLDSGDPPLVLGGAASLVKLLERRAKLLGLDARPDDAAPGRAGEDNPVVRAIWERSGLDGAANGQRGVKLAKSG